MGGCDFWSVNVLRPRAARVMFGKHFRTKLISVCVCMCAPGGEVWWEEGRCVELWSHPVCTFSGKWLLLLHCNGRKWPGHCAFTVILTGVWRLHATAMKFITLPDTTEILKSCKHRRKKEAKRQKTEIQNSYNCVINDYKVLLRDAKCPQRHQIV